MRVAVLCLLVALAALHLSVSGTWTYLAQLCQRSLVLNHHDTYSLGFPPASPPPSPVLLEHEMTTADTATMWCPEEPLCASRRLTLYGYLRCRLTRYPLSLDSASYRAYVAHRLHQLGTRRVKGWHGHRQVHELIRRTLHHADAPRLVLHFAGDNGVGKTRMAEVISLALAQRCGNAGCTVGDSTLELSGSSFDGLSVAEFRAMVIPLVVQHVRRFPRCGVVILNDLSALEPAKVRVLLPLLGRATFFPEHPTVSLNSQIVLITTDFGREGRTQGMSLTEMRTFIKWEFQELYGVEADSMVHTLPFLPISLTTASAIARMAVNDMVCGMCKTRTAATWLYGYCHERGEGAAHGPAWHRMTHENASSQRRDEDDAAASTATAASTGSTSKIQRCHMHLSDDAVAWLLESVKPLLSVENGRAVVQQVGLVIEPLLADYEERLHERHAQDAGRARPGSICEAYCSIDVNHVGQLQVQCE